ncbi:flagellar basal body rod protein FlgB [Clostridium sp. BL-8]|jgi:flagellar basal-body rod protein FlgB|uniref:flagellar basal body rod protein FlgB n=1 Tax=Clostridium sp. BL-8 TaxID=349938 RepID=UPI00098C0097|nr:flagellar basal body rod protein FlgB [Clostridium sp. BL-8]OOM79946.1 flagellar basal body rod protein FlgB [Clostridium sp. BL-8]
MGIDFIGSDSTYDLVKLGLNASDVRSKTIANNMANINTKDYKRFNVVFEENLKNGTSSSGLELKKTNSKHIGDDDSSGDYISIDRDNSTSMRSDGNNVDLDIEKVNQAANTLKYNALVTRINSEYNNMKTVLK